MRKLILASIVAAAMGSALAAPVPDVKLWNSEDAAQTQCPLDKVVWLEPYKHLYYYRSSKHYANSGVGGFVCRKDAIAAGAKPGQ
jgi:hypothetical protein